MAQGMDRQRATDRKNSHQNRSSTGHIALDLAATLDGRFTDAPCDLIGTPDALATWLQASGVASSAPMAEAADVVLARELRDAVYAIATSGFPATAVDTLNRIAQMPRGACQLTPDGSLVRSGSAAEFLATIAEEAIELFGGPDAARIRQCEWPACAALFVDLSRTGARRWCSMASCGNRAKVRDYRARRRRSDTPTE